MPAANRSLEGIHVVVTRVTSRPTGVRSKKLIGRRCSAEYFLPQVVDVFAGHVLHDADADIARRSLEQSGKESERYEADARKAWLREANHSSRVRYTCVTHRTG